MQNTEFIMYVQLKKNYSVPTPTFADNDCVRQFVHTSFLIMLIRHTLHGNKSWRIIITAICFKKRMITAQIHHISRKKDLMHWCECMLCVEKQEHEK